MICPMAEAGATEPVWMRVSDDHELALVGADLVCRNAKGKVLRSIPKAVRETPAAEDLLALRDWLDRHAVECVATISTWVLGSLPVPVALIAAVWDDPAWRAPLLDAVVVGVAPDGTWRDELTGFLRGIDPARGLGVVDLDGESRWFDVDQIVIPHPVLLDDLDDLREFAVELGIEQVLPQLQRQTFTPPADLDADATSVTEFANAKFAELRHATGRATSLGFRVRGGYATTTCFEGGAGVEARYWIGSDAPDAEAWTGDLVWVDAEEHALALGRVGPVAWSEGVRMASMIHAGRVVEETDG